jgi:Cu2+-exporting ATPase
MKKNNRHMQMVRNYKHRFYFCTTLTIPILILSDTIQSLLGFSFDFTGRNFLLLILSSIVFFYGGWPFVKGFRNELRNKQPGMMTLVSMALTVSFCYSSAVALGLPGKPFFWELATLVDVMLFGHWIEMRSTLGVSQALTQLAHLLPAIAHRHKPDGTQEDIPISNLKRGQTIVIKPGEKIPSDGIVISGSSYINQATLTGESKPIHKRDGDEVIGGSINGEGLLFISVTKTGQEMYLAQVIDLVNTAQQSKSRAQDVADHAAFLLTIIALGVGVSTFITWMIIGKSLTFSIERMVSVMVIACPHALGLAIPLVIVGVTGLAARNGLLIRNRIPFEQATQLTTVVVDKTGTLTTGTFQVTDIIPLKNVDSKTLLRDAASVEFFSQHPIAKSIVKKAKEKKYTSINLQEFQSFLGKGVIGRTDEKTILIGRPEFAKELDITIGQTAQKQIKKLSEQAKTIVIVAVNNQIQGLIALGDTIRNESYAAIQTLKKHGLKVIMMTGDQKAAAESIARRLGIDHVFAEVLPAQKATKIAQLQKRGEVVAMVGDGVNDAPALAQAHLGIAIGSGTDVARETGDVILVSNDPQTIATVISLAQITKRKTLQNLLWATSYNIVALPLAAGILYPIGFVLPPALGALIMSLSTIIVAVNSQQIKHTPFVRVKKEEK